MAHAALSLCPHLHPVSMPDLLLTTMTSRLVPDAALADKSWISQRIESADNTSTRNPVTAGFDTPSNRNPNSKSYTEERQEIPP